MGFFDLKAICGICNREVGLNRFKVKKSDAWICPECLKKAGGASKVNVSKVTIEEIKNILLQQEIKKEEAKVEVIKRDIKNNHLLTAEEMYQYCIDNNYGSGWNEKWGLKHFKIIETNLMNDEKIHLVFIGLHNHISATKNDGHYAYAITNKRIMMAQKNAIAGERFQTVMLDNINDITYESGIALGIITIDSIRERFNVGLGKAFAGQLNGKIHEVISDLRTNSLGNMKNDSNNKVQVSVADEIKKFKELLDMDAITEEEFNIKKRELLNL